jgi:hypothetical protein
MMIALVFIRVGLDVLRKLRSADYTLRCSYNLCVDLVFKFSTFVLKYLYVCIWIRVFQFMSRFLVRDGVLRGVQA